MTSLAERGPLQGFDPPVATSASVRRSSVAASSLRLLPWAFAFFNVVRLLSFLPMLSAIHAQGDASQHSLITWLTWTGANATMALWLFEKNGFRVDCAVAINACNAFMCLATAALILAYRF